MTSLTGPGSGAPDSLITHSARSGLMGPAFWVPAIRGSSRSTGDWMLIVWCVAAAACLHLLRLGPEVAGIFRLSYFFHLGLPWRGAGRSGMGLRKPAAKGWSAIVHISFGGLACLLDLRRLEALSGKVLEHFLLG
jgi:hypothetical protein